jgi:hypothetical protein
MQMIDSDRLRILLRTGRALTVRRVRLRKGEHFLKDAVPLLWLETAARLPGRSLHAGIALWCVGGVRRSLSVPLSNIAGDRFGLSRNAKYRALRWLETAGLISVQRKMGRAPIVTILHDGGTRGGGQ